MIRTSGKRFLKILGWSLGILILAFGLLCFFFPLPDRIEYSTIVLDNQGEIVHCYLTKDQQWRMRLDSGELTPLLKKTILNKEDKYFYYHPGVNPLAMVKSMFGNLVHGRIRSGASTITMQV